MINNLVRKNILSQLTFFSLHLVDKYVHIFNSVAEFHFLKAYNCVTILIFLHKTLINALLIGMLILQIIEFFVFQHSCHYFSTLLFTVVIFTNFNVAN